MSDYDRIGGGYAAARRPDPRIAAAIWDALGSATRVLNVGAGSGNYEPGDRDVVAVEPSRAMIAQRAPDAAPCVRSVVESLPFADATFDVAMGVLTAHHWRDRHRGAAEMRRVACRQVLFYFEPSFADLAWIMEYWPEIRALPTEIDPPGEAFFRGVFDVREIRPVVVPRDCVDGFGGAFWARPESYLDPQVRAAMSCFAQLAPDVVGAGHKRLAGDLASGAWDERFGHLRELDAHDFGYRIVIAGD